MRTSKFVGITALISSLGALSGCGSEPSSESEAAGGEPIAALSEELATTNDLTISHIQRLQPLDYVVNSPNPKVEGWPTVGSNVTWRGVIKNFSGASRSVNYRWFVDGAQVGSTASVSVPANGTANADFVRTWDFTRRTIKLVIDPTNLISEEEEQNNELSIFSDAISVGLWVEQSVYNYFLAHQRELSGAHSTCWENWAQRQMKRYNDLFAAATYPETPQGVLQRVRLDKITIVADNALPIRGGLDAATNNPDSLDKSVDLQWGFPAVLLNPNFYEHTSDVSDGNPFYIEGSLLHELGHARYAVDNYGFNVDAEPNGLSRDQIPHTENGKKIVGSSYLPMTECRTYRNHYQGLMDEDYSVVDRYSAKAFNLIAGNRAVDGNMNAPANFGIYINDLPAENRLTLLDDATGAALNNANVKVYRYVKASGDLYSKAFSTTPTIDAPTDGSGRILLGRNPFAAEPLTGFHDNTVIMLRVAHQGRVRYIFMDASDFNLEYWRGHTGQGEYTMRVRFLPTNTPSPALGFECPGFWTTTAGVLEGSTSPITQGSGALVVKSLGESPFGYVEVKSIPLSNVDVPQLGTKVAYDLRIPVDPPNPYWLGQTQVYLDVPSRGVNNAFIGSADLTGLSIGNYHTFTFTIPQAVRTALQGATYNDMRIKITLNVQDGSNPHLLDNLRFLP